MSKLRACLVLIYCSIAAAATATRGLPMWNADVGGQSIKGLKLLTWPMRDGWLLLLLRILGLEPLDLPGTSTSTRIVALQLATIQTLTAPPSASSDYILGILMSQA